MSVTQKTPKRWATNWEKISAIHTTEKGLVPRYWKNWYKSQVYKKKKENLIEKWAKKMIRVLHKRGNTNDQ